MNPIHDLIDVLPPTNPNERDVHKDTLAMERVRLRLRLRRFLGVRDMERRLNLMYFWVAILAISHISLIIVLYHVMTKE